MSNQYVPIEDTVETATFHWPALSSFQSSLIDLKEHASSLASAGLKRDSKLKSLEIAIEQKKEECSKLEAQLKKVSEIPENNVLILKWIHKTGEEETSFQNYKFLILQSAD